MSLDILAILIIISPLLAAVSIGCFSSKVSPFIAQLSTTSSVFISTISSYVIFFYSLNGEIIHFTLFPWLQLENFQANWSVYIDTLGAIMLIVVTTISFLVHLYSIGYMASDPCKQRFMAYLSLFTFCMLMLVVSDNFIQLFFGWEGVGLSSYLLIGFWFKKQEANLAAIKAFLVNRVGDIGLALGIFLIAIKFHAVDYKTVFATVPDLMGDVTQFLGFQFNTITIICLLLFIGCMGKSAQIGLHVWLPDAMEGPTPVSALIHAATMVTAGIFLLARCSPLFEYSETALHVIIVIGGVTCIFAASVALVQNDIKKIIAYSTCSQLGYMFFACGLSAYSIGVFHLVTHAFFKALLFLGAGSVIHALSEQQDIRKMGGIWKKTPLTYTMMWIGSLALAGIPPFSGFYSKDAILEAAYAYNGIYGDFAYYIGITAAVLTAFYSWRLIILVFHGKSQVPAEQMKHIHESSGCMLISLVALSIGAIIIGAAGVYLFDVLDPSLKFWNNSIFVLSSHTTMHDMHNISAIALFYPIAASLLGIALAYFLYIIAHKVLLLIYYNSKFIYKFLSHKWYFDEIYKSCFVKPTIRTGNFVTQFIEVNIIDAIPNSSAKISSFFAKIISNLQTGYVYHYAIAMILGLMILIYLYLPL